MIEKHVRELYRVDSITKDKGWKTIREEVDRITNNGEQDIMIDFKGVIVNTPWDFDEFKLLLKYKNVYMKFTNCEEMVQKIKILCITMNIPNEDEKVQNINIEMPKQKSESEKKVERIGNELLNFCEIKEKDSENGENVANEKILLVSLNKKYSQLQGLDTPQYVQYAIDKKLEEDDSIKNVVLDITGIYMSEAVLEKIANLFYNYSIKGINCGIETADSDYTDYNNKMNLFYHKITCKTYSDDEKAEIIHNVLKPGTVGLLMKYKKSRSLDQFGRHGNGAVVSSRIAIYRGLYRDKNTGKIIAKFQEFNSKRFYTKVQWMVEHDNESLKSLEMYMTSIPMEQLGLSNYFLGSQYHFAMPVQRSAVENKTIIVGINETGGNIRKTCTIPEMAKEVFDSWGIEYNDEALKEAIKLSKVNASLYTNPISQNVTPIGGTGGNGATAGNEMNTPQ